MDFNEKLELIDEQIEEEKNLYETLVSKEIYSKSDIYGTAQWNEWTLRREKEIFNRIDELQQVKTRLITGEKLPDVVYVDREKEVIKYIDNKHIHIYKSSFAVALLYFILICHAVGVTAWFFGLIDISVKTNF